MCEDTGGVRVAEYLTILPPRDVLAQKLRDAMTYGREQIARRTL